MKKLLYCFGVVLIVILGACTQKDTTNKAEAEDKQQKNATQLKNATDDSNKKDIKLQNSKKLGFSTKNLKEIGLENFAGRKYQTNNEYNSKLQTNPLKIEVFESFPIEFALYTKKDEQFPSAVLVYSSIKLANSTVESHYENLETTIEELISEKSRSYVDKKSQTIEDQNYTTYIFDKELTEDEVLEPITNIMHAKNQDLKNKVDEGSSKAKSEFEERAKLPAEFGNALIKAEQYLKSTSFSKQKLYDQLIFEKYSNEAAEYAVNNIKANWDEQALKKAKSYQESMEMSPEAIRDQLTSEHGENFTPDEAEYAIQNLGK